MVTAGVGTISGHYPNGERVNVSFYSSDVLAAAVTFSQTGIAVAGSDTTFRPQQNWVIDDISFTSSNTVTTAWVLKSDGAIIPGAVISIAQQLNTLPTRPPVGKGIRAGALFGMQQA